MSRSPRITKVWPDTLEALDKLRESINKSAGIKPPRTEVLDNIIKSQKVNAMTLNFYKLKIGRKL